ncbi:MAG: hypothetical protein QGI51_04185 [Dehalococcoidales bacterium]|jgi:hypothetical protein|nr:hypothetical protein [Dehalococcoidales bacterium]
MRKMHYASFNIVAVLASATGSVHKKGRPMPGEHYPGITKWYPPIRRHLLRTCQNGFSETNMVNNPYRALGLGLCLAGAVFAPLAYFIVGSVPLTAVGVSAVMIGVTSMALANTRPYLSPEASQLILKTGMENTAALLEELGLSNKAIYLPSAMRDGHPQALIPLVEDERIHLVRGNIPGRLIVKYGVNPDDMAIAVTTPGSINIDMLETVPGPTTGEIEAAATYILTGVLDMANSVTVSMADSRVNVEVNAPKLPYEDIWYYRCLGSPIASIVAAISSEALQKPVRIQEESYTEKKSRIVLEVLP